jgi:hypothetical protein
MGDQLTPEVRRALDAPEGAVLYSLGSMGAIVDRLQVRKSGETFHEYKVLGHIELNQEQSATAIREFESAATNWSLVVSIKG